MKKSNKEYKALKNDWYSKLKDSGFKDIENKNGTLSGTGSLSSNSGNPGHKPGYHWDERQTYNKSKEEYYRLAGYFLYEYKFTSSIEKYIWELHANGVSIRGIANILKGLDNLSFINERHKVHKVLKQLNKKMKEMYLE